MLVCFDRTTQFSGGLLVVHSRFQSDRLGQGGGGALELVHLDERIVGRAIDGSTHGNAPGEFTFDARDAQLNRKLL